MLAAILQFQVLRRAVHSWSADIQIIDAAISARAMYLMESHASSDGMQMVDALIAATVPS